MQESLNQGQQAMEELLKKVKPAPAAINRDELMYAAGRAAGGNVGRLWPWQTACAALLAICAGLLLFRAGPSTERTVVSQETPRPVPVVVETKSMPMDLSPPRSYERVSSEATYLELRNAVLTRGVDVLRSLPAVASPNEHSNPPALEGLEGVPAWQRHGLLSQGDHS